MSKNDLPTFEVKEVDYKKSWWRRGKLLVKWVSLIGAIAYAIFIVYWWTTRGVSYQDVVLFVAVISIALSVVYYQTWEIRKLNLFGIFQDGLAPPRKPKSHRKMKDRVILPYDAIEKIEYKKVGNGFFPNSHYGVVLHLLDGEEFEFDASEIYAQTRWKEDEVAKAQVIIEDLVNQFDSWKSGGRRGMFRFRPSLS